MKSLLVKLNFLNLTENVLTTFLLSLFSFLIPLFIGSPQIVVGTMINFILAYSCLRNKKVNWFLIILPSIGALTRGVLFGSFTMFLIYTMPIIWFGNLCFSLLINYCSKKKLNWLFISVFSSATKALIIFMLVLFLVKFSILPSVFLISMGTVQFFTALIGSFTVLALNKFKRI